MNVIEKYILNSPQEKQERLNELYHYLQSLMPTEVTEEIKWAMPTFVLNGNLVHFAYGKHHVGLYPGASGVEFVKEELIEKGYKYSKGAIQLPNNKPLPKALIKKIVKYRIKENQEG